MGHIRDLVGQKFGRLTVIEFSHLNINRQAFWKCECSCIGKTIKIIRGVNLTTDATKSCGCIVRERIIDMNKTRETINITCKDLPNNVPHRRRLKNVWSTMKQRCNNPNDKSYKKYGNKGVKVCEEWLNDDSGFFNFYNWAINNGYEKGLSIDRIDNHGIYTPENCRWATLIVQQNNTTQNILTTIRNETKTLAEWARESNLDYKSFVMRYDTGIRGEKLLEPIEDIILEEEILIDGISHTAQEWSKILNIGIVTFLKRYNSDKEGLDFIRTTCRIIKTEVNGEMLELRQISEKYNIRINSLKSRYQRGKRGSELIKSIKTPIRRTV